VSLLQGLISLNGDKLFNKIFNFSSLKKFYCAIAAFIVAITVLVCTLNPLNYGIDFSGGLIFNLHKVDSARTASLIRDIKNSVIDVREADISLVSEPEFLVLKIKENPKTQISNITKEDIASYLLSQNFVIAKSDLIGNVISKNFIKNVIFSIFFALLAVVVYIFIVFNLRFALAGFLVAGIGLLYNFCYNSGSNCFSAFSNCKFSFFFQSNWHN
jgi:preprotein translocase subunit SecF